VAVKWAPGRRFFNAYGPTEATVLATLGAVAGDGSRPSIGRPLAGTYVRLLDGGMEPVPAGVAGELYLGGPGLARGYLGHPELTAERFVPDPGGGARGARLYRTGDRARWRADGEVDFLGRLDGQVKLRGFRIELGEVEAALAAVPGVMGAAVVLREDRQGEPRLVGYVVPAPGEPAPEAAELRRRLAEWLPEHMLPSAYVALERLPLTPSGKVDRRSLPAPEAPGGGAGRQGEFVAPRDALERQLVDIWREVLNVPAVSVEDNFFALGGHSLLAVRLMSMIEALTGRRLPIAAIFQGPTVASLARLLTADDALLPSCIVPIQPLGGRPPLFIVHGASGQVMRYQALAQLLGPDRPVYGIQAAGLDGEEAPITRADDMVALYVRQLREIQPRGPYRLAGWSVGGLVVLEIARTLEAAGEKVAFLGILDSRLPDADDPVRAKDSRLQLAVFAQDFGLSIEDLALPFEELEEMTPDQQIAYVLERAKAAHLVPPDIQLPQIRRFYQIFRAMVRTLAEYQPGPCAAPVTFYRAAESVPYGDTGWLRQLAAQGQRLTDTLRKLTSTRGWRKLAGGGLLVRKVPGHHFSMLLAPNVKELAARISSDLEHTERE
jgi:thioesterase domain-containing protein/acyl carrier protein